MAQQALRKGIDYAFHTLNMHKVYLWVDVHNDKAVHIYNKLGLTTEETIKQQLFDVGKYHDSYFMGILKSDYIENH